MTIYDFNGNTYVKKYLHQTQTYYKLKFTILLENRIRMNMRIYL